MVNALILIADGVQEMEFTIVYDTLVRAGITVKSAFVSDGTHTPISTLSHPPPARGSKGIRIFPDTAYCPHNAGPDVFDALIIPGGSEHAQTIARSKSIQSLVREYIAHGKIVGLICAGVLVALEAGLQRQPVTSHPRYRKDLEGAFIFREDTVVISGNLITSRGPATTFDFALKIVDAVCGPGKSPAIREALVIPNAPMEQALM